MQIADGGYFFGKTDKNNEKTLEKRTKNKEKTLEKRTKYEKVL